MSTPSNFSRRRASLHRAVKQKAMTTPGPAIVFHVVVAKAVLFRLAKDGIVICKIKTGFCKASRNENASNVQVELCVEVDHHFERLVRLTDVLQVDGARRQFFAR